MKITVPIYIHKQPPSDSSAAIHTLQPLFHPSIQERGEDLNRAVTKLAQSLQREAARLGTAMRHEALARLGFAPDVEDHFYTLMLKMPDRTVECSVLVVAFRDLDRKLAFTPSVPDLWFDIHRGETLKDRAAEVLAQYFRQKARRHGEGALQPEAVSLKGRAWVTTLDIDISPPALAKTPKENLFAMLGGGDELDGFEELQAVGRCLDYLYPDDLHRVIRRDEEVAQLTALLDGRDQRPVLVIGRRLVGKTAIIHEYVYRTVAARNSKFSGKENIWQLSPQRLISGMSYVGQWENRLLAILKAVKERRHLLYFDDLLGLYQAGQTSNSALSVADVLKPYLEKRDVRLLGEITPEAFRVLQERDRSFADAFHLLAVKEPDEDTTLRILLHLMRQLERKHGCSFSTEVFPVVLDVQRRYARDAAFPGKAALLLQQLAVKFRNERVGRDDVLNEFHAKSGLSLTFLNDQTRLGRREVEEAIGKEVIGQAAAVEACADVVTMAKARLNDTDRPLASFLFLGPTGVGKTQCAKALAAYLFGDAEKIVRFDMNEYQSPYAVARLVGTFNQPEGLLTSAVRRQPFAVILLDEIEKAHPDVFNLLLQVMGDGRLTDALGRTVDFTNAIVILTSNLGVREAAKQFGFRQDEAGESRAFTQAAEKFFRPEFFNRLDRVVPFERLRREEVLRIARSALQGVLARDGLARRRCILQVEAQAMERVVDAGYDPQLGARAVRRMLERQVTQPVATRLATLQPDTPTLIRVYPRGDEITVTVEPLTGAAANHQAAELIAVTEPRRLIETAEQVIEEIEARASALRPEGQISTGDIEAPHLVYFQIKEQARHARDLCNRGRSRLEASRRKTVSPGRGRAIPANQFTLRQVTEGDLWRRLIQASDIHARLKELAAGAPPHGERLEDALADVVREVSFLNTIAQAGDTADHRAVLLVRSLEAWYWEERTLLAVSYATLFERALGMSGERLSESDDLIALQAQAALVRGVGARRVAMAEEGVHLFYTPGEQFVPLVVSVLPCGEDAAAAISEFRERQRVNEPSGAGLPPVIRVYEEDGAAIDLRSGLMTLKPPAVKELRALVLAGLPLPPGLIEGLQ